MTTNLFLFVFLLGFLMCAWMKKFLKNNHLIVFILINLLVSAKTKEKRKYKKDNEENIYTLSKTLPHGSLSYYYYKKNICSFFCNSWWSLFPCCNCKEKKILCVIIKVLSRSLVLLLLTAAYLSRKIIRKNDRKIVLQ